MKQGLQLRLSQQLAMTPQLQQAIRLLHLSTAELQQEIQLALANNPLLEQINSHVEIDTKETVNPEDFDSLNALEKENIPEELPLDVTWEEMYNTSMSFGMSNDYGNDNDDLPYYQGGNTQSLQDHLMWQVGLTPFSDTDTAIAISIIDAVDETGYLTVSLEEILATIGDKELTLDEVEVVLKRVQHFDPVGIASRNLRECLLVQLSQCATNTPYLIEARLIVADYLDLLGNHDYRTIIRLSRLKETALKEAIALIQSLDPRPGQSVVSTGTSQYVIPDVILSKKGNDWTVELNTDSLPHLKINQQYAALTSAGGGLLNDNDSQYIRSNLQEAKWLIKSLASRHETLLKVARCIVDQQIAFFEQGEESMQPMVLADVASVVQMHESTISRITTQKYLHSPRGIFELKYFFSSHVNTESGGEASSIAIRALIKKLIAGENPIKPLSDSKLTLLLCEQGIIVAGRTVAKYRQDLRKSHNNRRFFELLTKVIIEQALLNTIKRFACTSSNVSQSGPH